MDLGLPSGTLWLDRLVGAPSPSDPGLFYQWGAIVGHTAADFYFGGDVYNELGLNRITSDLDDAHDAAKAYYGPDAKMPSLVQVQELLEHTTFQTLRPRVVQFTSVINGNSIVISANGFMAGDTQAAIESLRIWTSTYIDNEYAQSLRDHSISAAQHRYNGINVLAVHS